MSSALNKSRGSSISPKQSVKVQGDISPTSLSDNRPPNLENPPLDSDMASECTSDGVTVRFDQQDGAPVPVGIDHHFVGILDINTTLDNSRRMALENKSLRPDRRYRLWPAWAIDGATRYVGDPATAKKKLMMLLRCIMQRPPNQIASSGSDVEDEMLDILRRPRWSWGDGSWV